MKISLLNLETYEISKRASELTEILFTLQFYCHSHLYLVKYICSKNKMIKNFLANKNSMTDAVHKLF